MKQPNKSKIIKVVSPGYNCEEFIKLWYNSLKVQSYPYWEAYVIDDSSVDNTSELVRRIGDPRIHLINRKEHYYQLGNWYEVIHSFNPDDLVVRLDLDDYLGSKYVFETIIKEYLYRGSEVFSITEFETGVYRDNDISARWYGKTTDDVYNITGHSDSLFCFPARMFQRIPKEDLQDSKGEFIRAAGDVAITAPILYQGFNKFYHLFIPRGLMYNTIRDAKYDDDKLVDEEGKRLQETLTEIFLARFRKRVDEGLYKVEE